MPLYEAPLLPRPSGEPQQALGVELGVSVRDPLPVAVDVSANSPPDGRDLAVALRDRFSEDAFARAGFGWIVRPCLQPFDAEYFGSQPVHVGPETREKLLMLGRFLAGDVADADRRCVAARF